MKEKISSLAKGVFDYRDPQIEISDELISLEVICGRKLRGYFTVRSLNGVMIRAMMFSSDRRMRVITTSLVGEDVKAEYEFDSSAFEPGENVEGFFTIVANGSEIELPFEVRICAPFCLTEGARRITDLEEFADLARRNWSDALSIFSGEDFEKVFLHNKKNRRIYRTLIKSSDKSLAMEEFLCTSLKKDHVTIHVPEEVIEYADLKDAMDGRLVIEKNGWGHVKIRISVTGNFIDIPSEILTEDNFLGSFCQLDYRVRPVAGSQNEGSIILETFSQKIVIPVRNRKSIYRDEITDRKRKEVFHFKALCRLYCNYRLGYVSRDEWLFDAREHISGCMNNSKSTFYRLLEAYYLIDAGRKSQARIILDGYNERELRYKSVIDYIIYLFVNAKYKDDPHYTEFVSDTIRFYADGQLRDRWEPLVAIIMLTKPYGQKAAKAFKSLAAIYENGNCPMIVFLEAMELLNREPAILREVSSFERSLFQWGVRHKAISRETISQYAILGLRMREYHEQYTRYMMRLSGQYESRDMLTAVLSQLTLGKCLDKKYNRWYLLGIESGLKIPDLYENYMASLDISIENEIPYAVIIYFQYDNRLPVDERAYLYRHVLEQKDAYTSIFQNYNGIIRAFTFDQLKNGKISSDLAFLYNYYLKDEELSPHVLRQLPAVMFRQKMKIKNDVSRIRRVIVDYEEIETSKSYETEGKDEVYIDLFLDDYRIFFEDTDGSLHTESVKYSLQKLFDESKYIKSCYEENPGEPFLLLNRSERALKYQMLDETSINVYKRTLLLDHVSKYYQKTILKNLIDYYYDSYEGETLEKYLLQIDITLLDSKERNNIIEYYIQRGLYDRAYRAVLEYGYENIQIKRIMRLCSRRIRAVDSRKDDFLIAMAASSFEDGRYDETILTYLGAYYNGPVEKLYAIWKASRDFDVKSDKLEERFLCEALFTGKMLQEGCEVFASYCKGRPDLRLVRAFLSVYSYMYLTDEQPARADVFKIMEIELDQMDTARDVCSLAMLKFASIENILPSDMIVDVYDEAAGFIDRGIIFPFFKKFAGRAQVPTYIVDMTFVICKGPAHKLLSVRLSADDGKPDKAKSEPMNETIGGLYVRGFHLIPGDHFRYQVKDEEDKVLSEGILEYEEPDENTAYGLNNVCKMIEHVYDGDEQALEDAIKSYDRFDEMTDRIFHLV